jgi:hypothetical protein
MMELTADCGDHAKMLPADLDRIAVDHDRLPC